MQRKKWLLAMDLDGTVWDNLDISSVQPPYKKIDNLTIENFQGIRIKLFRDAIDFILWAKNNRALVTTLSWNIPENAMEALKTFGIEGIFDFHLIEYHPHKDMLLLRLLNELKKNGTEIPPENIVYVDDRNIHIEDIKNNVGNVVFIHIWKEVKNYGEAKKIVEEMVLSSCID